MTSNGEISLKLFIVLSRSLEAVQKRVEENIRSFGLNPTEFAVLELVYHKGDQPIQKIGEKVLIASSSITYVVDKLEKKDLLKRAPCPKDRRVIHATITSAGKQLMQTIFPEHQQAIEEILGGLSLDEQKKLIEPLKKLGIYAEELSKNAIN